MSARGGGCLWLLVALLACRPAEPVATVIVEPTELVLAYPDAVSLSLSWEPVAELDRQHGEPFVFVHLLESPGHLLTTFDHPFPHEWVLNETRGYDVEIYQSALAEPLPPGEYALTIGLYDSSWGYRWPLATEGEEVAPREYQVATVRVPEASASASDHEAKR